ncbi:MAG: polyprenyl synthetase family protein [Bacteroidota bacterium]|nr:polyprenyl synthetase family protein [Bacteroidota bacterium]
MTNIKNIKAPILNEMKEFNVFFNSSMKTKVPLLNIITNYILKTKGKQMRPMLVFLVAKSINQEVNNSSNIAAGLIELLHTATLVHDDVVDESPIRRGFFSINALWKSKISVLVGDYLLSKGLLLAIENNEQDLLKIVSVAVKEMSEGELLQIQKSRKLDIDEETYYKIISKKTASLIAACTACGAKSAKADDNMIAKMHKFGELLGMAFQIKDDLFDYQSNNNIGKPTANDIKDQKLTLPIIYSLSKTDTKTRKKILSLLKKKEKENSEIKEIISFVKENGGIEYSTKKMNTYKEDAMNHIKDLPQSKAKSALIELVDFVVDRKK